MYTSGAFCLTFIETATRQLNYLSFFLVHFIVMHFPRHAEICHFGNSIIGQQDVASGKIAMKNLPVNVKYR